MDTTHTPGPWTPDRDPRRGMEWNVHILDQRGHAICFMAHSDGASPERDEANAALVAAAPDLLAALQGLDEAYCRAGSPLSHAERHEDRKRLIAARAAILKATGQAPTGGAE